MPGARGVRRYPDPWASTTWWGYGALALALLGALVMLGDWRSGSYLTGLVRDDNWVTVTRSEVRISPKSSKNPYFAVSAVRVKVPGSSAWLPLFAGGLVVGILLLVSAPKAASAPPSELP